MTWSGDDSGVDSDSTKTATRWRMDIGRWVRKRIGILYIYTMTGVIDIGHGEVALFI